MNPETIVNFLKLSQKPRLPGVTGIVLAWKRLGNLPPIIDSMLACPAIEEIVIWDNLGNYKAVRAAIEHRIRNGGRGIVNIFGMQKNICTLGRFVGAAWGNHQTIATCDDDCLVTNWDELVAGTQIENCVVSNLDRGHMQWAKSKYVHEYQTGTAHETLVGYGAAFDVQTVAVLLRYIERWGVDELLIRKADRIWAVLQNREHVNIEVEVQHLAGATGPEALYRKRDHWSLNRLAIRRALELLETT